MSYKRLGVFVTQERSEATPVVPQQLDFLPAVLGVPAYVVEGTRSNVALIESEDFTTEQVITLPITGAVVPKASTVKVYLALPGANLAVKHLSQEWFRERYMQEPNFAGDVPYYEVSPAALDLSDLENGIIKITIANGSNVVQAEAVNGADFLTYDGTSATWSVSGVNVYVEFAGIVQEEVKVTQTFVMEADEKIIKLSNFPVATVTSVHLNETELVANAPDETGYTLNRFTGTITLGAAVTVMAEDEVTVVYTYNNDIFKAPVAITSIQDIESYIGPVHPYNPLGFGAYMALRKAGSGPVYVMAVEPTAQDLGSVFSLQDASLAAALNAISDVPVYTVAVLGDVNVVGDKVQDHLNSLSTAEESKFRIAMMGFSSFAAASDNYLEGTPAQVVQDYIRMMYNYDNLRLRVLMNPAFYYVFEGVQYSLPGIYYSAHYAGMVKALGNNNVSFNFSGYKDNLIAGLHYPNGLPNYFTEKQLDSLAEAGLWCLKMSGTRVAVKHQVTTAENFTETMEDSIVRGQDWLCISIKETMDNMMATKNITRGFLNDVGIAIKAKIAEGIRFQNIGEATQLVSLSVSPTEKDTLVAVIAYDALYPANRMLLTVRSTVRRV